MPFSEQVSALAIKTIEPHPKFRLRSKYDVEELAEDIRKNGQRVPGRVVLKPDGKGYSLYEGNRRYDALMQLYREARTEEERRRYMTYRAFVDEGLTEEQMLLEALGENEPGIRKNLTPLEEVVALKRFDLSKLEGSYKRLYELKLTAGQAANLQKIEEQAGYTFKLPALEFLSRIAEEREMYETAAEIAETRYDRSLKKMEDAHRFREEALGLPWFGEFFPGADADADADAKGITDELKGIAQELSVSGEEAGPGATDDAAAGPAEPSSVSPPSQPDRGRVSEKTLLFRCPHCGGQAGYELGTVVFDGHLVSFAGEAATPVAMETVAGEGTVSGCERCGKAFYYQVKKDKDGRYFVVATKKEVGIAKSIDERVDPVLMTWDDGKRCWNVLDKDGRVTRTIREAPSAGPRRVRR
ncbi:MAG: ParB N-terminal domain-containing protein [Nitrososphaerota archaeon]|nr:ParB N-terminal domain-containing protein [Nitrososphaerota archaeon]